MRSEPTRTVTALAGLFHRGYARVPEPRALAGPAAAGLWWPAGLGEVVATPALLRLGVQAVSDGERAGLLLATEPRFREPWLGLQAARLADLGRRGEIAELCREIGALGPAAKVLRSRVGSARLASTDQAALELSVFGAPADQPAAAPSLLRVLGLTAPRIEGGQGREAPRLADADPRDPEVNWVAGRLLQMPGTSSDGGRAVLSGAVPPRGEDETVAPKARPAMTMRWVLAAPWATFLAVLVFTAEAWAAEHQGGLRLELPGRHVQHFARPPEVEVVVTLADGREILCGTLGELCLRSLDALGMSLVPALGAAELDRRLAGVIAELLRAGVWLWKPEARTHYVIGEDFSYDCYRGDGHRYVFLGADSFSQTLRSVAVSWARTLSGDEAASVEEEAA